MLNLILHLCQICIDMKRQHFKLWWNYFLHILHKEGINSPCYLHNHNFY